MKYGKSSGKKSGGKFGGKSGTKFREKMSKAESRKSFTDGALRVHEKNAPRRQSMNMRGGIRM